MGLEHTQYELTVRANQSKSFTRNFMEPRKYFLSITTPSLLTVFIFIGSVWPLLPGLNITN